MKDIFANYAVFPCASTRGYIKELKRFQEHFRLGERPFTEKRNY